MISPYIKTLVAQKNDEINLTKEEALTICILHVDVYCSLSKELQLDQEIIYVCLAKFTTMAKYDTLRSLMSNMDYCNVDILSKFAEAIYIRDNYYIRNYVLGHIDFNLRELPYGDTVTCKMRTLIFENTSDKIRKEMLFLEYVYKPSTLTTVFKHIDIGKFAVKPRGYDIFIKIE